MELRKYYTKESKLDAISLVLDWGLTIAEPARNLEIRANILGRWVRKSQVDTNGQAFRGNGKLTPGTGRNSKPEAQIRQLKLERRSFSRKERSEVFVHHPKEKDLSDRPVVRLLDVSLGA
jgi:transposase